MISTDLADWFDPSRIDGATVPRETRSDMTESDLQAAERRIDELINDLVCAASGQNGLDVQDCRDALQEAIAEYRGEPGWRPIETAPKDGTAVLLYFGGVVAQGWWDDDPYFGKKWRAATLDQHGCGCCSSDDDPPTHWMPLPAAPAAESEES